MYPIKQQIIMRWGEKDTSRRAAREVFETLCERAEFVPSEFDETVGSLGSVAYDLSPKDFKRLIPEDHWILITERGDRVYLSYELRSGVVFRTEYEKPPMKMKTRTIPDGV